MLTNCLMSADTLATVGACRAMGARVSVDGGTVSVDGGGLSAPGEPVDCLNSGTTMRIMAGLCSMFDEPVTITGDESLRRRPMGPLLEALESCGVECSSENGLPPVTVRGPCRGGRITIRGDVSSQFVTSLLLAAPMMAEKTTVVVEGGMVSAPYLDVTTRMMGLFGARVSRDGGEFAVDPTGYSPCGYAVPADYSSSAFPLVAGALGGRCTALGLDPGDPQGDKAILDVLARAGATVEENAGGVTVSRGELRGCDVDVGRIPDLFPIVAVLLSTAEGDSRLYGAPHLRFKESDRIETTVRMVNALGGDAEETEDGCVVHGVRRLSGGRVEHRGDHRIMMSAAVASVVCDGPVVMDDPDCASVSYPGFAEEMSKIGLRSEVERCTLRERSSGSRCSARATGPASGRSWRASRRAWRSTSG